MAYNSTIDKDSDDILIYANTAKDGSGTDYVPLTDADGHLQVDVLSAPSTAVTNAGLTALNGAISGTEVQVDVLTMPTVTVTATNLDVQSGGADLATSTQASAIQTAAELIDDAVYADDADWTDNTSKHINIGGVYQSSPHTVTDGDVSPALMDANGRLIVAATDNGGSLTVDNAGLTELAAAINSDKVDVNIASSAVSFGGTSAADDADFTAGTTLGTPAQGVYESTPTTVTDGDLGTVGITSDRRLKASAVVTGTVAVTQSGTWDEVGINDSGNSITVDGTVTASNTAGTAADNAATSGNPVQAGGKYNNTFPTYDDGDQAVLQQDSRGNLRVALINHSANTAFAGRASNADDVAVETTSTNLGVINRNTVFDGSTWDRMRGDSTDGVLVNLGSNNDVTVTSTTALTPGTAAANLGKAEDAQHASGDTGVMSLGVRAAAPTERSAGPSDGDYEPFATNEVGAVWVSVTPSANGGASTMNATSSDGGTALTNSAQAIKASAGTLKGYYIYNPNASAQFVQFYNTASGSVTVGTTNPLFMVTVPATSAANLWMTDGVAFGTAMSWAATSTAGGNGAPGTALDAVAWYK